jgi:hypothetical protein
VIIKEFRNRFGAMSRTGKTEEDLPHRAWVIRLRRLLTGVDRLILASGTRSFGTGGRRYGFYAEAAGLKAAARGQKNTMKSS